MKTPIWVYLVGIFMMLFGIYEAYSSLQLFNALRMLVMIENIAGTGLMEKFNLSLSGFERAWNIRFVYIGLPIWFLFIVSGIFLLIKKTYSIKLSYMAITFSVLFYISQFFVFTANSNVLFALLINLVLLVVLFVSDKTIFYTKDEFEE